MQPYHYVILICGYIHSTGSFHSSLLEVSPPRFSLPARPPSPSPKQSTAAPAGASSSRRLHTPCSGRALSGETPQSFGASFFRSSPSSLPPCSRTPRGVHSDRQWRLDAVSSIRTTGSSATVPTDSYGTPIYTSMLCLLLAVGILISEWWLFAVAFVIFMAGTEIRVRIEERLLLGEFGEAFLAYRKATGAYIPFL